MIRHIQSPTGSSYSGGSGTECVECAEVDDGTLIRDSKRLEGPAVGVRREAWHMLLMTLAHDAPKK
ncbi:DUF397 domain-containing protein [Streptomyces sp. Tue 6430]|nr:DUF397 domain-containing protein [Streptomyces sp. Tue 6430]